MDTVVHGDHAVCSEGIKDVPAQGLPLFPAIVPRQRVELGAHAPWPFPIPLYFIHIAARMFLLRISNAKHVVDK
jgi:hypothetical protein